MKLTGQLQLDVAEPSAVACLLVVKLPQFRLFETIQHLHEPGGYAVLQVSMWVSFHHDVGELVDELSFTEVFVDCTCRPRVSTSSIRLESRSCCIVSYDLLIPPRFGCGGTFRRL